MPRRCSRFPGAYLDVTKSSQLKLHGRSPGPVPLPLRSRSLPARAALSGCGPSRPAGGCVPLIFDSKCFRGNVCSLSRSTAWHGRVSQIAALGTTHPAKPTRSHVHPRSSPLRARSERGGDGRSPTRAGVGQRVSLFRIN